MIVIKGPANGIDSEIFKDHEIKQLKSDHERVKQFIFLLSVGTGVYGFRLTTGDNLIE